MFLVPQIDLAGGFSFVIPPGACHEEFISAAVNVTNLLVQAQQTPGDGPVAITLCPRSPLPGGCQEFMLTPARSSMSSSLDGSTYPALNPGSYSFLACNQGATEAHVGVSASAQTGSIELPEIRRVSTNQVAISDESVTWSDLEVGATGLVIAVVIVWSTWGLLRDSVALALNAVPEHIDPRAVRGYLSELAGVTEVHDLHIWAMSTTENALTAHLPRPPMCPSSKNS